MKLLKNRILVKPIKETKSPSGILLFDNENERPMLGEVIEVGPGRWLNDDHFERTAVQKGFKVYFGKHCGVPVRLNEQNLLVMLDEDIIAVEDVC